VRNLLEDAVQSGAALIATACPLCQVNLECYQKQVNSEFGTNLNVPVLYFTQLVGLAPASRPGKLGIGSELVNVMPALASAGSGGVGVTGGTWQETHGGAVETGEGKPMNPVTGSVSKGDTGPPPSPRGKRISIDPISGWKGTARSTSSWTTRATWSTPICRSRAARLRGLQHRAPREEMPQITSLICGVCPTAHHMAATKALDDLYKVEPTPAARKIRELVYQRVHVRGPRAARLHPGRPGLHRGPDAPPRSGTSWA